MLENLLHYIIRKYNNPNEQIVYKGTVMGHSKTLKWMILMVSIVISLMGIGYASFTHHIEMLNNISTSSMQYNISFEENSINISLDSDTSYHLLNLNQGDAYDLTYSLNKEKGNVPLKKINNKYIGSVTIHLNDVKIDNNAIHIDNSSFVLSCIPNTIGSFECFHNFDGVNGTITLIKQTEPMNVNCEINKSELSQEMQQLLGIDNSLEEVVEEKIKKDSEVVQIVEEVKEVALINIEGTYGFEIPLQFDQYNANVE